MRPADVVDRLTRLKAESGDVRYGDLIGEDLDDVDVAELWLLMDAYKTAANQAARIVGDEWVKRYAESGAIEIGEWLVYVKHHRTDEKCSDPGSFLSWLAKHPDQIVAVVSPNSVKKGSLPPAVRDTFFEKVKVELPEAQPSSIPLEMIS